MKNKYAGMASTLKALEVLREELGRPDLQVQTILVLLHVARLGEIPMAQLEDLTGMSQASISRNVALLADGRPKDPGFGLIEAAEDPHYRRRKIVRITERGKIVVARTFG